MLTMETEKTLEQLEKEQQELTTRIYKLRTAAIKKEEERKQQWYADNIDGNVYYSDKTTWSGYDHYMALIKPISCNDWTSYGTCKIESIEVYYNKDMSIKEVRNDFHNDMRYDMFDTHCKKCTLDLYNQFMDKILADTILRVEKFNIFKDEK